VLCPSVAPIPGNLSGLLGQEAPDAFYHKWWDMYKTVPIVLIPFIAPLVSCRDATFFTKFNSMGINQTSITAQMCTHRYFSGTLSVFYLVAFISYKGFQWGINADISDSSSPSYTPLYLPTFPALSGLLALSFFIHNIVITVMKNNRNQEKNVSFLSQINS
jgi:solute carrier family 38 (sodium-coupled neutral amino acid transporter), member 9